MNEKFDDFESGKTSLYRWEKKRIKTLFHQLAPNVTMAMLHCFVEVFYIFYLRVVCHMILCLAFLFMYDIDDEFNWHIHDAFTWIRSFIQYLFQSQSQCRYQTMLMMMIKDNLSKAKRPFWLINNKIKKIKFKHSFCCTVDWEYFNRSRELLVSGSSHTNILEYVYTFSDRTELQSLCYTLASVFIQYFLCIFIDRRKSRVHKRCLIWIVDAKRKYNFSQRSTEIAVRFSSLSEYDMSTFSAIMDNGQWTLPWQFRYSFTSISSTAINRGSGERCDNFLVSLKTEWRTED